MRRGYSRDHRPDCEQLVVDMRPVNTKRPVANVVFGAFPCPSPFRKRIAHHQTPCSGLAVIVLQLQELLDSFFLFGT
jgi:hypothetical protein